MFRTLPPDSRGQQSKVLGVRALVQRLTAILEDSFPAVIVEGEVTRFTRASSGHAYFDLVEDDFKLPAVMFRRSIGPQAPACLAAGNQVRAYGRITAYGKAGRYQIIIDRIESAGLGAKLAELAKLKDRLAREGLFDVEKKKPTPFLPRVIGVVTSPTGAAIRDIIRTIDARYPAQILVAPARVQGIQSPAEVIRGIRALDKLPNVDLIIVSRGGGSMEDLFGFNDEGVVRAIYECQTPIVTGIGHEIDTVLADLVADRALPTPTGAAEAAVPSHAELMTHLDRQRQTIARRMNQRVQTLQLQLQARAQRVASPSRIIERHSQSLDESERRLQSQLERQLREARQSLERRTQRLQATHPAQRLAQNRVHLSHLRQRLFAIQRSLLPEKVSRLERLQERLRALSPEAHLERGYALVQKDGALVRTTEDLTQGENLRVILWRGAAEVRVHQLGPGPFDPRPDSTPASNTESS